MSDKAAFRATYSDWRLIKTRKVVQIVFEVPVEQAGLAYEVLDGMPQFGSEVWCAIARLQQTKESAAQPRPSPEAAPTTTGGAHHKSWHEMDPAQQAGILCNDSAFVAFLRENHAYAWGVTEGEPATERAARVIRLICGVRSRSEIKDGTGAAATWKIVAGDYRAWMRAPEVV